MKKETKNKGGVGSVAAKVIGVAALSAAAYVLFGPEGKKNRKKISGWAIRMKGEIIEKFENLQEVTEPVYNKIVDEIAAKYAKAKNIPEADIKMVVEELKKHWKSLSRDAKAKTTTKKKATKTAKK